MNPFSRKAKLANEMAHQQSYSAEPYREGIEYTPEAWAYGLRALPGSLANQIQALGEYTTGKDYPNKLGNYLDELTQVNEMGYTPQTEYEAGVAFLPELVYDPAIIAGAPYTAYKAARNAPRLLNVIADEAGRTTMRNQLGMLAGPNAKNADLGMLAKAQEMKAQGVPTDDIYSETKWWLDHPDGVPRFEIDDSWSMPISQKTMSWGERADWEAGNPTLLRRQKALAHPKLSAAYPDSKNIAVSMRQDWGDSGSYKSDMDWITVGGESNGAANRSTMLHELQHAIQSREGMARGGSPEQFLNEVVGNYRNRDRKARNMYNSLAGEADARLVQNRMNMSMDERLANPFYKNYDVPIEDQIIRFDDGTSMSEPLGNLGAFKSQLGAVDLPMDEASRMARKMKIKKLYRGVVKGQQEHGSDGLGTYMLGKGFYSSPNKRFAEKYGDVIEVALSDGMPLNPLVLKTFPGQSGPDAFNDMIIKDYGYKNMREFHKEWPDPADFVRSMGYDGVISGDEVVKY